MGLFDLVKDIAGKAVGDAINKGVKSVVSSTVSHAANEAVDIAASKAETKINSEIDKVAEKYKDAPAPEAEKKSAASELAEAINELKKIDTNELKEAFSVLGAMAKEVTKDLRVCPNCGRPVSDDADFCPECGTAVPRTTVAEMIRDSYRESSAGIEYDEVTKGSFGETMPEEPNQYNFGGDHYSYFMDIFTKEFPGYALDQENGYGGRTRVVIFNKDGRRALVVELLSRESSPKKLREQCAVQGVPYLRFYYDYEGWWNTRAYVVQRVSKALNG